MSIRNEIKTIEQEHKQKIVKALSNDLDVNYSVVQIKINSLDEFFELLFNPFEKGEKIYYRGERFNRMSRKLLPTLLRNSEIMSGCENKSIIEVNSAFIRDFYSSRPQFMSVYKTVYNDCADQNLYNMLAFAQHYLGVSPLIDFTKNLYVALSFAIKGRSTINDDIVIYTAYDIDDDDTSKDIDEVNSWLENYNVRVVNFTDLGDLHKQIKNSPHKGELPHIREQKVKLNMLDTIVDSVSPVAKLIDIPRNDLMKYQQGVFLLLNDFSLLDSTYLTKTVRQSFVIKKYIISPDVALKLRDFLIENAPQYRYECLMNIAKAVRD
ncbi:MAG: FRG domain-containing protein [Eubacterium sp.]